MSLIIGITGNIGSGKTTVGSLFKKKQVPVIEADEVNHKILNQAETIKVLVKEFGESILLDKKLQKTENQQIDRRYLRNLVFKDDNKLKKLGNIVWSKICNELFDFAHSSNAPYVIVIVPLLFENQVSYKWINQILLVFADQKTQIERVIARDKVSLEDVQLVLKRQIPNSQKIHLADEILHNNGSMDGLEFQVNQLHETYIKLSKKLIK